MGDKDWKKHAEERIKKRTISEADLKAIINLANGEGIELVNIWVRGQPTPDSFCATFRVPPEGVGELVGKLVQSKLQPNVKVTQMPLNPCCEVDAVSPDSWIRGQPSLKALEIRD